MKILVRGSNFPSAGFIIFLKGFYDIDFQELPEYNYDFYYPVFFENSGNMTLIFNEYFIYDRKACEKGKNNVKFFCSRKNYMDRVLEKYRINYRENPHELDYDYIFESSIHEGIAKYHYFEGYLKEKRNVFVDFRDKYRFFYTPYGTFFNVFDQNVVYGKAVFLRKVLTYNVNMPMIRMEKRRIYYSPSPFTDLFPGYVMGLLSASYISSAALHHSLPEFRNHIF